MGKKQKSITIKPRLPEEARILLKKGCVHKNKKRHNRKQDKMSIRQEIVIGEIISNFPHSIQFIIIGELIEFGSFKLNTANNRKPTYSGVKLGEEIEMNKKVLIIEDSIQHQTAARKQLPDAVVVNYNEAFDLLCPSDAYEKYQAVLTDLFFLVERDKYINPSPFRGYPKNEAMLDTEQPFGMFFALKGRELGLPTAVVTDGDHHSNLFVGLLDMFGSYRKKGYILGFGITAEERLIPDPGFAVLYESKYPIADDMYWDILNKSLVMGSFKNIQDEESRNYDSYSEFIKVFESKWKPVKDWRRALDVILREGC